MLGCYLYASQERGVFTATAFSSYSQRSNVINLSSDQRIVLRRRLALVLKLSNCDNHIHQLFQEPGVCDSRLTASNGEQFVPRFGNGFIFPWNSGGRQNVALIFEDPLLLSEGYKTRAQFLLCLIHCACRKTQPLGSGCLMDLDLLAVSGLRRSAFMTCHECIDLQ